MSVTLRSKSKRRIDLTGNGWSFYLYLGEAYGWKPQGTQPPPRVPAGDWGGDYASNDGQTVTEEDSAALANAWEAALDDPRRIDKEREINVRLAEETVKLAKELYGIDLPFEDDQLSADETTLGELITFARLGAFTIH